MAFAFSLAIGLDIYTRVVLAPLTRCRATKSEKYPRTWFPDDLNVEYYCQRATTGGLLISEATFVSLTLISNCTN